MPGEPPRPKGALLCVPIIMINMGGEMIYILEQRLSVSRLYLAKFF
jgi:hypothetical protein